MMGSYRPSTLSGDVIRVHLVDDRRNSVEFDISAAEELDNGLIEDKWTNLILQVSPDRVDVIVDSLALKVARTGWDRTTDLVRAEPSHRICARLSSLNSKRSACRAFQNSTRSQA